MQSLPVCGGDHGRNKPLWPRTKSSSCEIWTEKGKEKNEISPFPYLILKNGSTTVNSLLLQNSGTSCYASPSLQPTHLYSHSDPPQRCPLCCYGGSKFPRRQGRGGWTPEAAAGGQGIMRGKGRHDGRVGTGDRTARGRTRGRQAIRPSEVSAVVRGIVRREGGRGGDRPAAQRFHRCAGFAPQYFWTAEYDIKVGSISLAEYLLRRSLF